MSNKNVSYAHQHAPTTAINQQQQQPVSAVSNASYLAPTTTDKPLANTVTYNNAAPSSTIPNNNVTEVPSPEIITTVVPPKTTTTTINIVTNEITTTPIVTATNDLLDNNQISNYASDNALSKREI